MRRSETGVLVRISAAIGLIACLGVFSAGLLRAGDTPGDTRVSARQDDPVAREMQRGQQAYREGRWDDAIAAYQRVVELRPDHGAGWFALALAVHTRGDHERAVGLHEKAAEFGRQRATALYNLACAHALLGRGDEAFGALDRAIDAGFISAGHAEQDSDLESIRDDERFAAALERMRTPDSTLLRFWVGEWEVYSVSTGHRAGENTLTLRNSDLFIHERWRDAQGGTGESFNYFDPGLGRWKQVWCDAGGIVEFVGSRQGAGILFEGEHTARDDGTKTRVRMHVRPIGDGHVRQTGTHWDESSQGWEPRYDFIYIPKGDAYQPEGDPAGDI